MKNYKKFLVLEDENHEIVTIPKDWAIKGKAMFYWPSTKDLRKAKKYVQESRVFNSTWPKYKIIRIFRDIDTYEEASEVENNAIEGSGSDQGSDYDEFLKSSQLPSILNKTTPPGTLRSGLFEDNNINPKKRLLNKVNESEDRRIKRFRESSALTNLSNETLKENVTLVDVLFAIKEIGQSIEAINKKIETLEEKILKMEKTSDKRDEIFLQQIQTSQEILQGMASKKGKKKDTDDIALEKQLGLKIPNAFLLTANDSKMIKMGDERKTFIDFIERLGAGDGSVSGAVNSIFNKIFEKGIAREFNWSGKKNKLPFKASETVQILYAHLQRNLFPNVDIKSIENAIQQWLKNKSDCNMRYNKGIPIDPVDPVDQIGENEYEYENTNRDETIINNDEIQVHDSSSHQKRILSPSEY